MNYKNIYDKLCLSRKSLKRDRSQGYFEEHHIVPKWLGGSNKECNLVMLTAREHYLSHYLLFMHYRDRSSSAAFHIMNNSCNMKYRDSRKYEEVRTWQSENLKGVNNPSKRLDVRKKISDKVSGKLNGMYGRVGSLNPAFGMKHSEEFLERKRKLHGKRTVFRNIVYDSIRQASKETGISRFKILKELN